MKSSSDDIRITIVDLKCVQKLAIRNANRLIRNLEDGYLPIMTEKEKLTNE